MSREGSHWACLERIEMARGGKRMPSLKDSRPLLEGSQHLDSLLGTRIDAVLRCAKPGRATGRPAPSEVVASDGAERVEHFTAQKQARMAPALERSRIHLVECDPTASHLGLLVSLAAAPWQDERCQQFEQRGSFLAAQFGGCPIERDARFLE